jgi:hypothetical protein
MIETADLTNLLAPYSTVLLEKLTGLQLLKNFHAFYGTRRFIIALTSAHHVTRHKPIHSILSTAPQLSISQKALVMLTENGNVIPKHVGATIRN